jgi:dUTP pyrophosphatase
MAALVSSSEDVFVTTYTALKGKCKNSVNNYAILKVAFASEEIALLYEKTIEKHNKAFQNNAFCDSGFDLFVPENAIFDNPFQTKFVDMKLKAEMIYCNVSENKGTSAAFYLYPRSSLSKTELMMANHVGIIDSGYRGSIMAPFRWLPQVTGGSYYAVEEGTRLVQVCHPSLCPIYICVVNESQLSSTERGVAGFGSTGR